MTTETRVARAPLSVADVWASADEISQIIYGEEPAGLAPPLPAAAATSTSTTVAVADDPSKQARRAKLRRLAAPQRTLLSARCSPRPSHGVSPVPEASSRPRNAASSKAAAARPSEWLPAKEEALGQSVDELTQDPRPLDEAPLQMHLSKLPHHTLATIAKKWQELHRTRGLDCPDREYLEACLDHYVEDLEGELKSAHSEIVGLQR